MVSFAYLPRDVQNPTFTRIPKRPFVLLMGLFLDGKEISRPYSIERRKNRAHIWGSLSTGPEGSTCSAPSTGAGGRECSGFIPALIRFWGHGYCFYSGDNDLSLGKSYNTSFEGRSEWETRLFTTVIVTCIRSVLSDKH